MGFLVYTPPSNRRRSEVGGRRVRKKPQSRRQWLVLIPLAALAIYFQHTWLSKKGLTYTPLSASSIVASAKEVPCPTCIGEDGLPKGGRPHPDNFSLWEDCPVCFGAGRRLIKTPNPAYQTICPQCSGMGRYITDHHVIPCERCGEWGLVETAAVEQKILISDDELNQPHPSSQPEDTGPSNPPEPSGKAEPSPTP